ncbi:hypothetical protein Bpfe_017867 [Biomphalaria pfeifferi]|uniref:Uncharacterized protein n=1 Tax=Biomphalaria pfeifferi TaxID=112525 RepID=A0AAD8BDX2_BIOPF|nr:hypothetical protein Bpfe_017867 [Biomphalaria pfeifferi]
MQLAPGGYTCPTCDLSCVTMYLCICQDWIVWSHKKLQKEKFVSREAYYFESNHKSENAGIEANSKIAL